MRRVISIIIAAGLLSVSAAPLGAIERKEADKAKPAQVEGTKPKVETTKTEPKKPDEPKRKSKPQSGYDDFIDKNNNGIDDRAEVRKPKSPTDKKAPESNIPKKKGEKK
ncbi:MAG: hypothetical protein AB1690_12650 [Candidatus Zixiibacteriota bacterium]|jgi:hypothetical protein